ncbi:MAG: hypothetical protein KGM47_06505, partial [Acidobacteriota bacterium]|nr:hypothetical protein [Acidobacteriota bacterium]
MNLSALIADQARRIDRWPTEAQRVQGNYRKGHIQLWGLNISIENPRGSIREGIDPDGKRWRVRMPAAYGYIRGTKGADGSHVDAFLGPHPKSQLVYVIDQKDAKTGKWDEHKCFLGFSSPKQVKRIYEAAFSDGRAKDRLGALHEMTIAQFKDWLKLGDTTKPVKPMKHREAGGRIGMAGGGKPNPFDQFDDGPWNDYAGRPPTWDETTPVFDRNAPTIPLKTPTFDPSKPFEAVDAPAFDPSQPFDQFDSVDRGTMHALGHGAFQGLTANFGDELRGVYSAGRSVPAWIPGARMMEGAARLAGNWMTGNDPEALADYERGRDAERQAVREAQAFHPTAYTFGEVGGSLPTMAAMPETGIVRGAGLASRLARGAEIGAEYGGLSGAGEGDDLGQRIENAGSGVLGGGAGGLAGAGAGEVLSAAGNRFVGPVVRTVRGWMDPEAEAERRVASAISRDTEMIAAGKAKGLTPAEWIAARNAGEPVTLADLGAGNMQALLRSAANTSPEGRAMLEQVIQDRFLNQGERVAADVRNLVAGGANAGKSADQLVAEYEAGRAPVYRKAFSQPAAQSMFDESLEQIAQAPVVQQAIRMANITGRNEAAKLGLTPMRESPFAFDQAGRLSLRDPDVTPNLQYWDAVKKNLDQLGPEGQAWARTLRDHLDSIVPEYGKARGFAANFFGERDALQAGRTLAGKRVDPDVIKQAMRQMSPQEQDLFREGYASDWAGR